MTSIFVTGTDTDIGKTIVSTCLALQTGGDYWKPIQSGLNSGTDSQFVAQWIGKDRVHPEAFCLNAPLSPHHASEKEGFEIDLKQITPPPSQSLIVEGAGGVFVPINQRQMMIDLIQQLNFPTLIVARSKLGTLNHTFLTLNALRERNIPLLGVALAGPQNDHNRESIESIGRVPVIAEINLFDRFSIQNFNSVRFSFLEKKAKQRYRRSHEHDRIF